jgi:hypothetical protein
MKRVAISVALLALLGACGQNVALNDDPETKLVGTWQHRAEFEGGKVVLTLAVASDRKFVENARFTGADGRTESHEYSGEWSYDGNNFKRRYLTDNGRKFSGGSIRYATLEIASISPKQFVGKDNVRHREFSYDRVSEGTKP